MELLLFTAVLLALLSAIAISDFRTFRIPNSLNLALFGCGIAFQALAAPDVLLSRIAFAVLAALTFLAVRETHRAATGIVGLGLGDVKMAGAAAVWLAPIFLPFFIFAASFLALCVVVSRAALGKQPARTSRLPFGPFLAMGAASAFFMEHFNVAGNFAG